MDLRDNGRVVMRAVIEGSETDLTTKSEQDLRVVSCATTRLLSN